MNTNSQIATTIHRPKRRVNSSLFALWIAMASIVMMFGSLTSSYIVRHAAGNWLEFRVPDIFFYSTAVILLSSLVLHLSYWAFKTGKAALYRTALPLSLLLGVLFIVLQYKGWLALYDIGVPLDGNPSGSFFYVISGIHAAHVLGGLFAISVATMNAFSLTYRPTEKRRKRFQLVLHYWHFVDFLWVYLFLFLLIQ
ncbi:MAG: cytochrome c oxidase subunit 3 [Saprospiraceae bacterium]